MKIIRQEKHVLECCSEEKDFHVYAKWDGCCDITRYYNGNTYETGDSEGDNDYIHICDLREFIRFLTDIADEAEQIKGFEGYDTKKED